MELDNRIFWDFGLTDAEAVALKAAIEDTHLWQLPELEPFLRQLEERLDKFLAKARA